jgi:hypothetical protein
VIPIPCKQTRECTGELLFCRIFFARRKIAEGVSGAQENALKTALKCEIRVFFEK